MKKYFLTFSLFFCAFAQLFAQDDPVQMYERQIGLNISGVLSQLPILPNDGQSTGNYAMLFKRERRRKPGTHFRFTVGGRVGVGNFVNTAFNIGLGRERPLFSEGRWQLNYGYDFVLFVENSAFSAGVGVGYGPLLGVRFDINKHISLLTEGSAFVTLSAGPSSGLSFTLRPPTGLILVFRFERDH